MREPDKDGLQYYLSQYTNKKLTMEQIKKSICDSEEASIKKTKFLQFSPIFKSKYSDSDTREKLLLPKRWYHTFKIGNMLTTPTRTSLNYQMWTAQGIPLNLEGKSVIDIGANDGFYSFLCESRGAKRVLAIDSLEYEGRSLKFKEDELPSRRFQIIKDILNSNVEYKQMNVYEIDKLNETFDLVLLFGVYYHLGNPISAIQKISKITNHTLFLSGHVLCTNDPLMYFYDSNDNCPNRFSSVVASPQCLMTIGRRNNFSNTEILDIMDLPPIGMLPHMFGKESHKVATFKFSK